MADENDESLENMIRERTGALEESERRYRLLADNVTDVIWTTDLDLNFTYLSPSVKRLLGYEVEEALKIKLSQILTPASYELALNICSEELAREGQEGIDPFRSRTMELEHIRKDGSLVWVEAIASFLRHSDGQPYGLLGASRDISEWRRMVDALRQSEAKACRLAEENNILAQIGRIISSSVNIQDIYEQFAQECQKLFPCDRITININRPQENEVVTAYFWGREVPGRSIGEPIPLAGTISEEIIRNRRSIMVTEKSPELTARFPESRYLASLEFNSLLALPLFSQDRVIGVLFFLSCQPGAYTEGDLQLACRVADQIAGAVAIAQLFALRDRMEEERQALEERLRQSQKMETIGTLAGGIAHDFNNILAAVIGYAELAGWDLPEGSRAKKNLAQCLKATQRARDLVQQILAFSRQSKAEHRPLDIIPLLKEGLKLLRASLPATVELKSSFDQQTAIIMADPTGIQQVILNLCTNAAQATGAGGGCVEASLTEVQITSGDSFLQGDPGPGSYVRLRISDNGHGIDPKILPRIFDPYFTTREVGRGTGLGLSVVLGIVKDHRGAINIRSKPGCGTTFDVYFPVIETAADVCEPIGIPPLASGQGERLLFVDDEEAIVDVARRSLRHLGYKVTAVTDSRVAWELFARQPDCFDLLITDLTMPRMTGDRLACEVMRLRPDIPIIVCTGYSEHFTEEQSKAMGIAEYIMKPLVMKELARTVQQVLDRKKTIRLVTR